MDMQNVWDRLAGEFPENFVVIAEDVMGINPRAFEFDKDIDNINDVETETETLVRNLFKTRPDTKIFKISFKPAFDGGTITISGKF